MRRLSLPRRSTLLVPVLLLGIFGAADEVGIAIFPFDGGSGRGFPVIRGSVTPEVRGEGGAVIEGVFLLDLGANHGIAIHWPTVEARGLSTTPAPGSC